VFQLNFEKEYIHDLICVYRKLLPNHEYLIRAIHNSEQIHKGKYIYEEWTDWLSFGKYSSAKRELLSESITVNGEFQDEFALHQSLGLATSCAISNYVTSNNVSLPDSSFITTPSLARYKIIPERSEDELFGNLAMGYHSDFQIESMDSPGDKFLITCITYLGDDYEGGEIQFFVLDKVFTYKPKSGDILVFPSGSPLFPGNKPYFHSVKCVLKGDKIMARNFLKYPFAGTKEWHENIAKYGIKEWTEMSKQNEKLLRPYVYLNKDGTGTIMPSVVEKYKNFI
jgi:hypothetical protein